MTKRIKRNIAAFQAATRQSARYHISPYTIYEQAVREHIRRGFGSGLERIAGLLNQANKI